MLKIIKFLRYAVREMLTFRTMNVWRLLISLCLVALQACSNNSNSNPTLEQSSSLQPRPQRALEMPPCNVADVCISGQVTFDFITYNSSANALDIDSPVALPARGIDVALIDGDGNLVGNQSTDAQGNFAFSGTGIDNFSVRAYARLYRDDAVDNLSWDFLVADNTQDGQVYYLETPTQNLLAGNIHLTLHANSGLSSSAGLIAKREAAPFSILDTVYTSLLYYQPLLKNAGLSVLNFPSLSIYWSSDNSTAESENCDATEGCIGTSFYSNYNPLTQSFEEVIYLLGDINDDIDEYDPHVIAHEFNHYLIQNFSRDDSVGGPHSLTDRLDLRVALSEGLANAFAADILDDPLYIDSSYGYSSNGFDIQQGGGFRRGWFNEASVHSIFFKLLNGFNHSSSAQQSIINVLVHPDFLQSKTFAGVHSVKELLIANDLSLSLYADTLYQAESIFGSSALAIDETNDAGISSGSTKTLPIYQVLSPGDSVIACSTDDFSSIFNTLVNKLNVYRYLLLDIPVAGSYRLEANRISGVVDGNPDMRVFLDHRLVGIAQGNSGNSESLSLQLDNDVYRADIYSEKNTQESYGDTCYLVSLLSN